MSGADRVFAIASSTLAGRGGHPPRVREGWGPMKFHDPVRLQDNPDATLRAVIRSAESDTPDQSELDALGKRLGVALPAAAAVSLVAGASKSVAAKAAAAAPVFWSGLFAKTVGTAAIVVAVGGAAVVATRAKREPATVAPVAETSRDRTQSSAPKEAPEPTGPPVRDEPVAAAPIAAPSAPARPRPSVASRSSASDRDAPTETQLLEQAADALRHGDASRALRLTAEHASTFPRGALAEERERIAIEALARSGQMGAARARAKRFRARYPESTYNRRLDVLLSELDSTR
jgi:hypothetical protein